MKNYLKSVNTVNVKDLTEKGWNIHQTSRNRVAKTITPKALKYLGKNFPTDNGIILDVGCSLGETTRELARKYQNHLILFHLLWWNL